MPICRKVILSVHHVFTVTARVVSPILELWSLKTCEMSCIQIRCLRWLGYSVYKDCDCDCVTVRTLLCEVAFGSERWLRSWLTTNVEF